MNNVSMQYKIHEEDTYMIWTDKTIQNLEIERKLEHIRKTRNAIVEYT